MRVRFGGKHIETTRRFGQHFEAQKKVQIKR